MSYDKVQFTYNAFQKMGAAISTKLNITGLNDTPTGYLGHSGDYLVVNDGEAGIHFTGIEKIANDLTDYGFLDGLNGGGGGGDVDLSPVDSDISSLATVITTIDSDVSSLAVAGGGSVDLNPLNSDISSLATASSLSSFGEADVVAYLDGNLDTHIIPNANAAYDIGSAEYKIRHFYLSDNSLKFVD